jgi:hypothetical protein
MQLFVPEWKFATSEMGDKRPRISEMVASLDALKGGGKILAYAFIRDQPLIHSGAVLRLLLAVPALDEVRESDFPRA